MAISRRLPVMPHAKNKLNSNYSSCVALGGNDNGVLFGE